MATTKISQIIIRKGNLNDMTGVVLAPGEFMLAGDEQRLFLGQQPVTNPIVNLAGADATTVDVTFSITEGGQIRSLPLDLDNIDEFSILVTDHTDSSENVIPGTSTIINDTVITVPHQLGRDPVEADTFVLRYNKEVTSYRAERDVRRLSTKFTNAGGVVKTTGIDFLSSVKNDISIEYALFNATHMRKGTLNILVNGNTTSSIEDKFIGDSELSDVEFSITNNAAGKFTLNFNTALTTQLEFNYTQTSSKFVTS